MELYDNQGSSTPLTAKCDKSLIPRELRRKRRPLELVQKWSFLFAVLANGRGFYRILAPPLGERLACEAIPQKHLPTLLTHPLTDININWV